MRRVTHKVKEQRTSYNIKSINLVTNKFISLHQTVQTKAT